MAILSTGDRLQGHVAATSETKKKLLEGSLAGLMDAKEKAAMERRFLPQVYNLLGQPIALYTRTIHRI